MKPFVPLIAWLGLLGAAFAQNPPEVKGGVKEIRPGVYEIGSVRIDQRVRIVSFPGEVNMTEGPLEYLLVHTDGATHESLLSTNAQPMEVHLAMLLLGAKGSGEKPESAEAPPTQITKEYLATAPKLAGDSVQITIRWKTGDKMSEVPAEDWLINEETKTTATRGPWIYNGSRVRSGHFLAQAEGSFAALVTNPSALMNNPRKGNDNDLIWAVNTKAVPAVKTPVEILIKLESPTK